MTWQTIDCERVLYVDRGINTILCDRNHPGPVTLVVKLRDSDTHPKDGDGTQIAAQLVSGAGRKASPK